MVEKIPDHRLRLAQFVATSIGFIAVIAGFAFYAGKMDARQLAIENAIIDHTKVECHGQICIRVSVLETQVSNLTLAIGKLVGVIELERQERKHGEK